MSAGSGQNDFKEYIYVSWWWVVLAAFLTGVVVGLFV